MTCLRSTFVLKVFSIGESGKRINMEEIETLRAALARANKLIDEQANEIFRLNEEIRWYAGTGRKPREKRAVVPRNKDGTKLKPMNNDTSEKKTERDYHGSRGTNRLL